MQRMRESFSVVIHKKSLKLLGYVSRCVFMKKQDFPGHLIGSGLLEVDDKSASGESVYNFAVTLFPGLHGFLGISK